MSPIVHEKCKVTASRIVYDSLQYRQDRQRQPLGLPVTPLVLRESELAPLPVLLAEPDDIGAALSGEQHESQCEPRFASDRVTRFKLLYFFRRPGMESGRARLEIFNI